MLQAITATQQHKRQQPNPVTIQSLRPLPVTLQSLRQEQRKRRKTWRTYSKMNHSNQFAAKQEMVSCTPSMNSSTFTDQTEQTEEFEWGASSVDSMLGRALCSRESPKTIMVVDGEITTAAATCPTATLITETFETLLRVRQAEFAFQAGYPDPDSWDTGAVEPGVRVDITRELTGPEMGSAFKRWR